jgi:hypothetical protein
MAKYINRDGGSGFNWNSNDNFKETRKVRDVDNVLDIVFIHMDGRAVSVNPQTFLDKVNSGSITATDSSYVARCHDDAKEPVLIRETNRDGFRNTFTAYGGGSWHSNGSDEVSNWSNGFRENFQWESMRQGDPGLNTNDGKCTEFSLLYHRLDAMQLMFHKGYQLFDMNNFNSWKNWIGYPSSGGTYYIYAFVMFLSAENHARVLGCFNPYRNDMQTTVERLFSNNNGLTNRSQMTSMANSFCSNPIPPYSFLSNGRYGMGTTIWSPNTRYKLFVQPDGNLVAYEQQNANSNDPSSCSPYWSTSSAKFSNNEISVRPILSVQTDGNIVLYRQKSSNARVLSESGAMWNTNSRGDNMKFGLANNGDLYAFTGHPQTNNLTIHWSSSNTTSTYNDIMDNFYSFNSKCSDSNYTNSTIENIKYRYEYCSRGHNAYRDSNCKTFFQGYNISGDTNGQYKKKMDDTIKNICSNVQENSQNDYKEFCACVQPLGNAKTLFDNYRYHPKCWEQKCINNGYKLEEYATEANKCPTSLCIQEINLKNLIQESGSKIEMSCNIGNDTTVKRNVNNTPNNLCGTMKIRAKCLNANSLGTVSITDCLDDNHVNSRYQKFQYNPTTKELKTTWSSNNPKCITAKGGKFDNNTEINLSNCDKSDSQKFLYDKDRNQIVSEKDQTKCLDLQGGNTANGTGLQLRTCEDGYEGQLFKASECSEAALQNLLYSNNLPIEDKDLCGTSSLNSNSNKCINFSRGEPYIDDCSNTANNTKVFMMSATDGSIRPYKDSDYCFETGSDGKVYVKMCEDIKKYYESGTVGTIPARQKFLYNTATKQIHLGENNRRCINVTESNGKYTISTSDCNDSNTQKFNMGSYCTDSYKKTIELNETTRVKNIETERQRLAEIARINEENRLAEIKRLEDVRVAEEKRLAEEARKAEEARRSEEARLIEERRVAEMKRLDEIKMLEEKKRLEDLAVIEEERRVEELRRAEELRKLEEAKQSEDKKVQEVSDKGVGVTNEDGKGDVNENTSDYKLIYIFTFLLLFVCIIIIVFRQNNKNIGLVKIWGQQKVNLPQSVK